MKLKSKERVSKTAKLWCDHSQEARDLQMQLQASGYKLKVIHTGSQNPTLNYCEGVYSGYAEIRILFLPNDLQNGLPYISLHTCEPLTPELVALVGAVKRHTLIKVVSVISHPEMCQNIPMPNVSLHSGRTGPARRQDFGPSGVAPALARIAYGYGDYLPKWGYASK